MKPLDQPGELQAYYRDGDVVAEYMRRRTGQPLNGFLHAAQVHFLNQVIRERSPTRVLEIAPGPARLTAELDFDGEGVAIDASAAMLAAARERLKSCGRNWLITQGNAFTLPFADGCFDFVYTFKFIRHFQLADRQRLYGEIRRVLSRDGSFVLDAQNRAVSLPHRQKKGLEQYPIYDVLYEHGELDEELEAAGFHVCRSEGILKHFGLQMRLNRLRLVGLSGVARFLIGLLERLPSEQPSTWVMLGQRDP